MNGPTVQNIFWLYYSDYLDAYNPSTVQAKAANCIINCKTGAYGSNMSTCGGCGHTEYHHNSCRNRSCPMCQELPKEKWIDAQKEDVLDAPYYHVVFTLPHELNPLIYYNQKELYGLLYDAAADTLKELSMDKKYLSARPGFLSVMHTWGSDMSYHPHLHVIQLGGGLNSNGRWLAKDAGFFLPVKVISKVFRGKYMEGLKILKQGSKLLFHGEALKYRNSYEFQELLDTCYGKEWAPYCKEAFNGAASVIEYLGRYTHRIAVSNSRIISIDDGNVTYRAKDYRSGGRWIEITVTGVEFIRRFLMHVVPRRFVRIRYYGLLSSRCKKDKLALCRNLIGCRKYLSELKGLDTAGILKKLFGIDINVCPCCGSRNYIHHMIPRGASVQAVYIT